MLGSITHLTDCAKSLPRDQLATENVRQEAESVLATEMQYDKTRGVSRKWLGTTASGRVRRRTGGQS